jgi:hypothetical protein
VTGSKTCVITGYDVVVGSWVTIAGNDQPVVVTAKTFSSNTTAITVSEANKFATAAGAAITVYVPVLAAAAYAAGWSREIRVDTYTQAPVAGRLISIGTGATRQTYNIIEAYVNPSAASETLILLDRPLVAALADNETMFPGPAGEFNLAFHKNALALVNRPMARPMRRGTMSCCCHRTTWPTIMGTNG